jgi:hypothetical protein
MPSELRAYSTRRLLIWRVRLIMLICVAGGVIFGSKEFLLTQGVSAHLRGGPARRRDHPRHSQIKAGMPFERVWPALVYRPSAGSQ